MSNVTQFYRCNFCSEEFSNHTEAVNHASECQRNPANKQCCTCEHYNVEPLAAKQIQCKIDLKAKQALDNGELNPPCDGHKPWTKQEE